VSIDPAAQLRHELRTPLNHIIGYTELLLEELADGGKHELTAGLAALRTDARQLLTLLNEVLARGQAGPPDLASARDTLGASLERVRAEGEDLHRRASETNAAPFCRIWNESARPPPASPNSWAAARAPPIARPRSPALSRDRVSSSRAAQ
jgi:signal transduction histidine kinase